MLKYFVLYLISYSPNVQSKRVYNQDVIDLVEFWSEEIGKELKKLSDTMTRKFKVKESFNRLKNYAYRVEGGQLVEDIADELRKLMDTKANAAQKIAEYAEYLSFHRPTDPLFPNGTYHYFNSDNFTDPDSTDTTAEMEELMDDYMKTSECRWWCHLKDLPIMENNLIDEKLVIDYLFRSKGIPVEANWCDCDVDVPEDSEPWPFYKKMPMKYNYHSETEVNMNFSIIKTVANVYDRDQDILEGARWTEPLDLIFKENFESDPTLTWQYFTSPHGYMRHYPATKWSSEPYDQTYDMRTRSWYTEAMTSPKDIVILLDKSGSTKGLKRQLGAVIVNNILDTLNDNDFVNIFLFNNITEPLVPCFEDTLVQANEENLRLLREYLPVYSLEFCADIRIGYMKAFKILERFRENHSSSKCNQAIMLITEQLDYDYHPEILNKLNENQNIRIFTYLLGTNQNDRLVMEDIACENMGYYANISRPQEVREHMLKYLTVMSRPINYAIHDKQNPIWSYLYVDLADRRICNWLWKKREGIRQREVFLDHTKRLYKRTNKILTSENFNLLKDDAHTYEPYERPRKNYFMTTVSFPVYDRRPGEASLIGVAAVDVPISLMKSLIPHHTLGVNGYAFVVTNNGYILMHPYHRPTFGEDLILKPTFNRVDLLEVEILDDRNEPRLFDKTVEELREKVVYKGKGESSMNVKLALDDLKRIILTKRHYYYTDIGPFGFAIVLPDRYGHVKINDSKVTYKSGRNLMESRNWKIHPIWKYCENCGHGSPESKVRECLRKGSRCKHESIFQSLLKDAEITRWFDEPILNERIFIDRYYVSKIFIATRSGLTRWRTFKKNEDEDETNDFELLYPKSIEEDWYKRAVEENYENENMFIYSVPFEISGYENNTLITGTNAIFVSDGISKIPVATIGLQFNHRTMNYLYKNITTRCKTGKCNLTCESDYLSCFILDNNAYIVLSDNREHTGRYIGDLRPDIMYHLVNNGVYKPKKMFDYQGICYNEPREENLDKKKKKKKRKKNAAVSLPTFLGNIFQITSWAFSTVILFAQTILGAKNKKYKSDKNETRAYEKLQINKTLPTPCDKEMWLFTLSDEFEPSNILSQRPSKFVCPWPYVVNKIPGSNLLFLAINMLCKLDTVLTYNYGPKPTEIIYINNTAIRQETALPCYIAINNNYTRHIYTKCYKKGKNEKHLNNDRKYCGHFWNGP